MNMEHNVVLRPQWPNAQMNKGISSLKPLYMEHLGKPLLQWNCYTGVLLINTYINKPTINHRHHSSCRFWSFRSLSIPFTYSRANLFALVMPATVGPTSSSIRSWKSYTYHGAPAFTFSRTTLPPKPMNVSCRSGYGECMTLQNWASVSKTCWPHSRKHAMLTHWVKAWSPQHDKGEQAKEEKNSHGRLNEQTCIYSVCPAQPLPVVIWPFNCSHLTLFNSLFCTGFGTYS